MRFLDTFLNGVTMYRLTLWGLSLLALLSLLFGFFSVISYNGFHLLFSLILLLVTCFFSNVLFVKIFHAAPSVESSPITALILYFLLMPAGTVHEAFVLVLIGILAMLSKYLLAIRGKHIFNPAALGAFVAGALFQNGAIWWVGSSVFLPFVAALGFLLVRKIRREALFLSGILSALITLYFVNILQGTLTVSLSEFGTFFLLVFSSWPLLFFASVMLTEPTTTPPTKFSQIIYGSITGVLFGLPLYFDRISMSPELALLVGNIYSFAAGARDRFTVTLLERTEVARSIYHLTFSLPRTFSFLPGQYLEWTLPHASSDNRGTRRYFTIASAPTEKHLGLGVKMVGAMSTYKQKLLSLAPGEKITVSQRSGDFVLPKRTDEKLVFLAGGIGITPFRSMVQWLLDTRQQRDIVLFYLCTHVEEFAYLDIFQRAEALGLRIVLLAKEAPPTWDGLRGSLDEATLTRLVPDFRERTFYISGPSGMVRSLAQLLRKLSVRSSRIITDYFPGL